MASHRPFQASGLRSTPSRRHRLALRRRGRAQASDTHAGAGSHLHGQHLTFLTWCLSPRLGPQQPKPWQEVPGKPCYAPGHGGPSGLAPLFKGLGSEWSGSAVPTRAQPHALQVWKRTSLRFLKGAPHPQTPRVKPLSHNGTQGRGPRHSSVHKSCPAHRESLLRLKVCFNRTPPAPGCS